MTPDEEIGSPTTRAMIEDLARRAAFALVTEPARDGGKVVTARKGVGRFEVHVEGGPAHSGSRHQDGRSAIREAARQILAIEGMTDYGRGVTTTVGMISGGTAANVSAALPLRRRPAHRQRRRRRAPRRRDPRPQGPTIPT